MLNIGTFCFDVCTHAALWTYYDRSVPFRRSAGGIYNRAMKIKVFAMALLLMLSASISGCAAAEPLSRQMFMLDTTISISLYDTDDETILDGAFELCSEYEQLFSRTIPTSDVYRINTADGAPVEVSDATAELLALALDYAQLSGGAFDPTIEPLSALWDITSDTPHVPEADDIARARALVDWTKVHLDGNTVTLDPGMGIDLGGIAKGYIADRIRDYLASSGVTSALINLGGNVLAMGSKPDGAQFTVGVRKPFGASQTDIIGAYRVSNMSVVTSGIYERYFEQDGTLYHHILDSTTGYPVVNDIHSVTILSPNSTEGDVLSTICFVLGVDKGLELVDSLDGIEAVYCMADGSLVFSEGATEGWLYPDEL